MTWTPPAAARARLTGPRLPGAAAQSFGAVDVLLTPLCCAFEPLRVVTHQESFWRALGRGWGGWPIQPREHHPIREEHPRLRAWARGRLRGGGGPLSLGPPHTAGREACSLRSSWTGCDPRGTRARVLASRHHSGGSDLHPRDWASPLLGGHGVWSFFCVRDRKACVVRRGEHGQESKGRSGDRLAFRRSDIN